MDVVKMMAWFSATLAIVVMALMILEGVLS